MWKRPRFAVIHKSLAVSDRCQGYTETTTTFEWEDVGQSMPVSIHQSTDTWSLGGWRHSSAESSGQSSGSSVRQAKSESSSLVFLLPFSSRPQAIFIDGPQCKIFHWRHTFHHSSPHDRKCLICSSREFPMKKWFFFQSCIRSVSEAADLDVSQVSSHRPPTEENAANGGPQQWPKRAPRTNDKSSNFGV